MINLTINKEKRLHNNHDLRPKTKNSSYLTNEIIFNSSEIKENSIGKKALMLSQTPILSFTSFQSYLQGCNQDSFIKKQNEKLFRSEQKHKTQENFNPKKQIFASSQNKKYKIVTEQDIDEISPFQTDKEIIFIKNQSVKSNRKAHSKSQSSNYDSEKSPSFVRRFLHQKVGQINGWNLNENSLNSKKQRRNPKSVLKEKSNEDVNSNFNKFIHKKTKNNSKLFPQSDKIKVSQFCSLRKKSSSQSNKENVSQILPVFIQRKKKPKQFIQNGANNFNKTYKKSLGLGNCLTEINELEQQILMSKRQDITNRNTNSNRALKTINTQQTEKQQSTILRLKKQAEYLCNEYDNEIRNKYGQFGDTGKETFTGKSKSMSIHLNDTKKYASNDSVFKPFVKFPQDLNKINPIDTQNMGNEMNGSFQFKQKSSGMFKVLQSVNPNHQNSIYQPRTPIKPGSNRKKYSKLLLTENDLRNASKNKQNFHNSIKERKSKSAFNSITRNEKIHPPKKRVSNINTSQLINSRNDEPDKLLLTIVNCFQSVKSVKPKTSFNKHNLSLTKCFNTFANQDKNQLKRIHTQQSFNQPDNDSINNLITNFNDISQFLVDSCHPLDFSLKEKDQNNFNKQGNMQHYPSLCESSQPLQNLSKLSQEIKRMKKITTPISISTKYNKKFYGFQKSIKNDKGFIRSQKFQQQNEQNTENLCISTQIQGRKIHRLRNFNENQQ